MRKKIIQILLAGSTVLCLLGCGSGNEQQDVSSQTPVIPLIEENADEGVMSDSGRNSEPDTEYADLTVTAVLDDSTEKGSSTDYHIDGEETGADAAVSSLTPESEGSGSEYVEMVSTQLSEAELASFSAYFNKDEVRDFLATEYEIPSQMENDTETQEITCTAGSVDSNGLYSIFYKKSGEDGLWNVILRENEDGRYIHSNTKISRK